MSLLTAGASAWLGKYRVLLYVAAAGALLAAGATGGWRVATWRADAARGRAAEATLAGVQGMLDKAGVLAQHDTDANAKLAADLDALRHSNARLKEDLTNAKNLYVAGACTGNPFGPDFKRLWDRGALGQAAAP
jgi:hypothetical protein